MSACSAVSHLHPTGKCGLRDYGIEGQLGLEKTPEEYVVNMVKVFREVRRVLRDDGVLFLNLGDSYWGGKGRSAQAWSTENQDRETLQKSQHQISGMGDTRPQDGKHDTIKPKDLCGIPWRVAFALQSDGWWLRSEITWCKRAPMPESVTDRPTSATEKIFMLTKSARYWYDSDAVRERHADASGGGEDTEDTKYDKKDADTAVGNLRNGSNPLHVGGRNLWNYWLISPEPCKSAHFAVMPTEIPKRCILASTSARGVCPKCGSQWTRVVEKGLTAHDGETKSIQPKGSTGNRMALLRQAARERGEEYQNNSRTIDWKPSCDCNAGDPIPATVLDPFLGSGTTLQVAEELGRIGIGIELKGEYVELAKKRTTTTIGLGL